MTAKQTKRVMVKNREECGQTTQGLAAMYSSWAEQMLRDKLADYNRNIEFGYEDERFSYEVIQETEKAYKLKITGIFKNVGNDYEECEPWDMWLPKKACIEVK